MSAVLRLHEDILSNDAAVTLPALPRVIFVVHGAIVVGDNLLRNDEAWSGEAAVTLKAGREGAAVWRWELALDDGSGTGAVAGSGVVSREKLAAVLETLPRGPLLMRGDSVAFPAGGCAYLHRHQGPGIRCLIEGGIRIDYARPFDLVRAGRRLVRKWPGACVRPGRRPADPLRPRHDPAAGLSGQKLGRVSQRSG